MKHFSIYRLQKQLLSLLFFCLSVVLLSAQQNNQNAIKLYKNYGYKLAITEFESSENLSVDDMAKLADSYRLNHETENAELWYGRVIQKSDNPIYKLYYAQALQSNKKYDLARKYFIEYDQLIGGEEGSDQRGKLLAAAIERMSDFDHADVNVENVSILNSSKLDFSPSYYNNGIVFVSTCRPSTEDQDFRDKWIDDNFMSLFYAASLEDGSLVEPSIFSVDLSSKYHEGPVSFSKSGDRIFFTRNDYLKGKGRENSKGVIKLEIYTSFKKGNEWTQPHAVPFNTLEYEEAHPSLSADGQYLFFSSDRPGGQGGMDIYVSKNIDGTWSQPINLGPDINTLGNEVFPYFHDDGTLYFSSNGHGGIGGLDIFKATMVDDLQWTEIYNMGTPFNSSKDDFGFITNFLGTEGYFTSAREGGKGKDDIYRFTRDNDQRLKTKICAYDSGTNDRLEGVEFSILVENPHLAKPQNPKDFYIELKETDINDEYQLKFKKDKLESEVKLGTQFNYVTGKNGYFSVKLDHNKDYVLIARKNGYMIAKEKISTKNLHSNNRPLDFCIPLKNIHCVDLEGIVVNKKYDRAIPNADVMVVNLCTGEEYELKSDVQGAFSMSCLECGCDYIFKASKKYFSPDEQWQFISEEQCKKAEKVKLKLGLGNAANPVAYMSPNTPPIASSQMPPPTPAPMPNNPNYAQPTKMLEGQQVIQGAVIEMKNIFYDFDQDYIRDDASVELDKIVSLMYQYPSMVLEMSSHTDARGSKTYNENLSQRRAESAVQYLMRKGIAPNRLIARGYGESAPRNSCSDHRYCSEEEHQWNRRTEIRILHLGDPTVQVNYIDNAPSRIDRADERRRIMQKNHRMGVTSR